MPTSRSSRAKKARKAPSVARPRNAAAGHAYVGGWSQHRGDFIGLLLGIREGKRRKLTYIGEVKVDPDGLAITLLEPRLRESEIESSPFVEEPPEHRDHAHHWIDGSVVAEIDIGAWSRDGTIKNASLRAVADRPSFRRANWVVPPK